MAVKVGPSFRGRLKLFDTMVGFTWKGLQVFRSEAPSIRQMPTNARKLVNTTMSILAARFFKVLTQQQRFAWDEFASLLNSQSSEVSNRIGSGSQNVIRNRGKLMSGFNAYIFSNLLLVTRGLSYPRDTAPIAAASPNPALNVTLSVVGGVATVSWSDPDISMFPIGADVVVSIFAQIQRRKKLHTQLISAFPLPTAGTATFSAVRTGNAPDSPSLPLASFTGGELLVQMDTIAALDASTGAVVSAPSNVAEAIVA